MDIVIGAVFTALSFVAIYKIRMYAAAGISKHWFAVAFAVKIAAAAAMLWMYWGVDRNKADIFRFYDDSQVIYKVSKTQPLNYLKMITGIGDNTDENRKIYRETNNWEFSHGSRIFSNSRLFIRYLAFVSLLTLGSYYGILVVTLFLSFTGLFWIFRFFQYSMPLKRKWVFALVFFTPSVVFWTSGLLKESLLIALTGLILNCGNLAFKGRKPVARTVVVLIALIAVFNIKAYYAMILVTAAVPFAINRLTKTKRIYTAYIITIFVALAFVSESDKILGRGFYKMIIEKKQAFITLAAEDNAGSLIETPDLQSQTVSFLKVAPVAVANVLLRPYPGEAHGFAMWLSVVENILLAAFVIFVFFRISKQKPDYNVLWFSLMIAVTLILIIGWSTPVLGAISRYRVIPLIFLEMALLEIGGVEAEAEV